MDKAKSMILPQINTSRILNKTLIFTIAILLFLFLALTLAYYLWLKEAGFFSTLLNFHCHSRFLFDFFNFCRGHNLFDIANQFFAVEYWPKLHYVFTILFLNMFGMTYISMAMVNTLYLFIIMFVVYGLSLRITKNCWCALFSSFVVTMYPGIIRFMTGYELPIGVIAFSTLSVYFLVLSESFNKATYSALFALSTCCAMYMDRFSPIFFILGPYLYMLLKTKDFTRIRIGNLLLAHLIILLILFPFYSNWIHANIFDTTRIFDSGGYDSRKDFINFNSPYFVQTSLFYLLIMPQYQLGIFWFILFCLALLILIKNKKASAGLLLSWIILPLLIYTVLPKKNFSYTLPLLSPIAIITAYGIFEINRDSLRRFCIFTALMIGLISFTLFLIKPNDANRIFCYRLSEGYEKNTLIAPSEVIPEYPFEYKNYFHWLSDFGIKDFLSQKDVKIQLLTMPSPDQVYPNWWDIIFKIMILLKNPTAVVFGSSLPNELNRACLYRPSYFVFQKNISSDITPEYALKEMDNLYKKNGQISDDCKIQIPSLKLYMKNVFPEIKQEIFFYRVLD